MGDMPSQSLEQARPMEALVDYQEGAVVSRTVLKKPKGTVTLFAFDAAQALSEHTVPHDALVHLLDGEAEITVAGVPQRLTRGATILMPADKPHAVRAVTRFKMVLTMIRD
jgi:quercetin dioxygenase-like cupin family protein